MNGKILLDTNAVIHVFAGDVGVLAVVAQSAECFLPSIVLGELYYGVNQSAKSPANLARLNAFCETVTILSCDAGTAIERSEHPPAGSFVATAFP